MEAAAAFHRCVYKAFAQTKRCSVSTRRIVPSATRQRSPNAARCFSSSSFTLAEAPPNSRPPNSQFLPGRELFDTPDGTQRRKQDAAEAGKTVKEVATERRASEPVTSTEERVEKARALPDSMRIGDPAVATNAPPPPPASGRRLPPSDASAWALLEDLGLSKTPRRSFNTPNSSSSSSTGLNPLDFIPERTKPATPAPRTGNQLMQDITNSLTPLHEQTSANYPSLRLTSTLGRTISVDHMRNIDLTRAFRMMEQKCIANNVRTEERRQLKHVRKGKQKKLDRMERWRKLFKEGYLAECARIRRMRKQGW